MKAGRRGGGGGGQIGKAHVGHCKDLAFNWAEMRCHQRL